MQTSFFAIGRQRDLRDLLHCASAAQCGFRYWYFVVCCWWRWLCRSRALSPCASFPMLASSASGCGFRSSSIVVSLFVAKLSEACRLFEYPQSPTQNISTKMDQYRLVDLGRYILWGTYWGYSKCRQASVLPQWTTYLSPQCSMNTAWILPCSINFAYTLVMCSVVSVFNCWSFNHSWLPCFLS